MRHQRRSDGSPRTVTVGLRSEKIQGVRDPRRLLRWVSLALLLPAFEAPAWIYPEHREIGGAAISGLDAPSRARLDRLWAEARAGREERLCAEPWAGDQGTKPACLDFASWPAIAADHSCSPDDLLSTALDSQWILGVARIAAEVKVALATATSADQARNRLVRSDLDLARTDPGYATRAGAGNFHFLLARTGDDLHEYLGQCTAAGAEPNALGLWARSQLAAEGIARDVASGKIPEAERAAELRRAFAVLAFGLHFLEDTFAAGHVAGAWGDVATRKGTHDFYNGHGLDTTTWGHEQVILHGDAWMRPAERDRAARTIREGLERFLAAADPARLPSAPVPPSPSDGLSACVRVEHAPSFDPLPAESDDLARILGDAPLPTRGADDVALPRFRAEIGPFLGLAGGFRGAFQKDTDIGSVEGGSGGNAAWRGVGSLDIGLRAGFGLDALIGRAGDGQVFLGAGVTYQAARKTICEECTTPGLDVGSLLPSVPARTGLTFRLRVPFWLVPGDLLLAAPVLALTSPPALEKMVIASVNGGLIPWQTGLATPVGRVQFVLGREVGVTFFGYVNGEDLFLAPVPYQGQLLLYPVAVRSIDVDLPVLEVRPFRDFGHRQTTALLLQLGVGADVPTSVRVWVNGGWVEGDGTTSWYGYLKVSFDWRSYL